MASAMWPRKDAGPLYVQAGADYEAQVRRVFVIAGAKRDAMTYAYARS